MTFSLMEFVEECIDPLGAFFPSVQHRDTQCIHFGDRGNVIPVRGEYHVDHAHSGRLHLLVAGSDLRPPDILDIELAGVLLIHVLL